MQRVNTVWQMAAVAAIIAAVAMGCGGGGESSSSSSPPATSTGTMGGPQANPQQPTAATPPLQPGN